MKKLFLLSLGLFLVLHSYAQSVTGYITSPDKEGIPYANIVVLNSNIATATDSNGNFSLDLDKGNYQLSITAVGYASKVIAASVAETPLKLEIELSENTQTCVS